MADDVDQWESRSGQSVGGEAAMTELPLDGVRVVELGGGIPAAFATRLLAGFGADVVRVEGLGTDGPGLTPDEEVYLVAGKRRVDTGVDLKALVAAADILVEDGPPGRLAALGLAAEELRRQKPSMVVVSISPFGQTGPYRDYKATNIVSFASGGIMSLTGDPSREPLVSGGSQAQYLGGLHAFSAASMAYLGALLQGEGDTIDLSLQECAAGMLELYGAMTSLGGPVVPRMGNQTRAEWGIYPCADGWAGVFTLQRQVKNLFEAIGDPELINGPWLDSTYRLEHPDELGAHIYVFMLEHTKDELLEIGQQRKVPIGIALTPADLLEAPAMTERAVWDEIETPRGTARVPGRPFAGVEWRPLTRLHGPGEDTEAVSEEWLGVAS
jgi:crotonobetainyl-CoA:carnitine CoA-transferase CaiB-like acyl-CoA transferase